MVGQILIPNEPNVGFEVDLGMPASAKRFLSDESDENLGYGAPVWQSILFSNRSASKHDGSKEI